MIIMYGDCDIDEKTQVLRKISEAEKCFAQLSDTDISERARKAYEKLQCKDRY